MNSPLDLKWWSGLVSFPFSFQFFTRLAAVFAEEVGGFTFGIIQRCPPKQNIHSIHLRTLGDE